jgi:hypothetical protein
LRSGWAHGPPAAGRQRSTLWRQDQSEGQIEGQIALVRAYLGLAGAGLCSCSAWSPALPAATQPFGDSWLGEGLRFDSVKGTPGHGCFSLMYPVTMSPVSCPSVPLGAALGALIMRRPWGLRGRAELGSVSGSGNPAGVRGACGPLLPRPDAAAEGSSACRRSCCTMGHQRQEGGRTYRRALGDPRRPRHASAMRTPGEARGTCAMGGGELRNAGGARATGLSCG